MSSAALLFSFWGCGGGGSDDNDTVISDPPATTFRSLSGNVAVGPVSGAEISVKSLSGGTILTTVSHAYEASADSVEYNATVRRLKPFAEQSAGRFHFEGERTWWPTDATMVLVTATSGEDIDPDGDGYVENGVSEALGGTLTAYVRFGDLRDGNVTLNLFTTAAAAILLERHVRDSGVVTTVLDAAAKACFSSDPIDGGVPDYRSLYRFNPARLDGNGSLEQLTSLVQGDRYAVLLASSYPRHVYDANLSEQMQDSDKEGLPDAFEMLLGADESQGDSDGDGANDYAEAWAGTGVTIASDVGTDPLYEYQWHLDNIGQNAGAAYGGVSGEDMNTAALETRYAGSGEVVVALLDEGAEWSHPDLRSSIDISLSYNYETHSLEPDPSGPHGTACAGIIAAQGWNDVGVRGVAPMTRLAVLNIFATGSFSDMADGLLRPGMDIYSNSWGPVDSDVLTEWDTFVDAVQEGTESGRDGKGALYVFAAGNDREIGQHANANTSSLHNSKYVIAVGAVAADGTVSSYSNPGANLLVSGPGGEYGDRDPALVTTDLEGPIDGYDTSSDHFDVPENEDSDYTNRMNGTSAATPAVAGVAALMLQANPDLTWRDVKYILAHTARQNDPGSSEWAINGAGLPVSHDFGFGMVDAAAAVAMAEAFAGLPDEAVTAIYTDAPALAIPDNDTTGATATIDVTENITIEHVDLWFSSDHDYIDDLEIILVSPSGTESTLAWGGEGFLNWTENYNQWRFSTVHAMDESSAGTWTLIVKDLAEDDIGQITNWKLQISGH